MAWLIVLSSLQSHAASGKSILIEIEAEQSPAGYVHLDKAEQSNLATYIKQCELDKMNLKSSEQTLSQCMGKNYITPAWWQTSSGVISISIGTLLLGFALGNK
jgi:hypothetical protein